jgi:V/A-type H+-transporting ATPase subunit I
VLGLAGTSLVFVGLFVGAGSRAAGIAEAVIELFDTLLRLGSNVVSFTRLAAFGLTHAVITAVVWDGTTALWHRSSWLMTAGAIVLFVVGNVAAFALGALVAAIQALRLEYYELFSRLFASSGRPFTPWHVPVQRSEIS